jgi:DNA/RNA-binding protein KIN17
MSKFISNQSQSTCMGKERSRSTKKIWNLRGPEKLKFYCQMCEKQCRDNDGFTSHCSTPGHLQMMKLFLENEEYFTEKFSTEFQEEFLEIFKRKYQDKVVLATEVYDSLINESRNHIHLNSTKWTSLDEFVIYLGKNSICKVDQSQKGWIIRLIQSDEKEKKISQVKEKIEVKYEDRKWRELEKLIDAAKKLEKEEIVVTKDDGPIEPIKIVLPTQSERPKALVNVFDYLDDEKLVSSTNSTNKRKLSSLEMIKEEEDRKREKRNRSDHWIHTGIIVKIVEKGIFYKEKARIVRVIDKYTAVLDLLDLNKKIELDQKYIETVIPTIGNKVLIVNGAYREEIGTLVHVDFDNFCGNIKSDLTNQVIKGIPYEDFSKYVGE